MKKMYDKINGVVDNFFRRHRMYGMKDIIVFVILTVAIHFLWNLWDYKYKFFPIQGQVTALMDWFAKEVLYQSTWILNALMNYQITIEGNIMRFPSGYDVAIDRSCGGMKHIMQFMLLLLLLRGSWLKKLWFIPLGILIVHFTNVLRIFIVGVLSMNQPEWMRFAHDEILRWMFYLLLCCLWLIWVKIVSPLKTEQS
jgi:exosortase/archaeosortase family protein